VGLYVMDLRPRRSPGNCGHDATPRGKEQPAGTHQICWRRLASFLRVGYSTRPIMGLAATEAPVIERVRLKNFKSFRDVEVRLGPFTVLVGPNMSGKSNFIEALKLLQRICYPGEPGPAALANAFPGGLLEHTWKGAQSPVMEITVAGSSFCGQESEACPWEYQLRIEVNQWGAVQVASEALSLGKGDQRRDLIVMTEGRRALVNRDNKEVLPELDRTRASIELDIPNWDGSFLRREIGAWRFYRLRPERMRNPMEAHAPMWLATDGGNLAPWLLHLQTRYEEAFARIQQACRDTLPGFRRLFSWLTPQGTVLVGSEEEGLARPVSVREMSDGELVFIALLSLLFSPPELSARLYCIEEPENHLHPRLIEVLIELLRQVQQAWRPWERAQVIASTHSLHLIDRLMLEELVVFQKRDGETVVTHPVDKSHLQRLLEDTELGLGDLFYSGILVG